ncbi:PepSY domain-containing protein [Lyngbya confervoides]|uniref:PepSY domain-containing protein n=1 Tax=Lyngbya confervoides BDU141951 TaxID=1574623 RepID=A0ABD4T0H8_9CYAN|nr:PepSY domain-containing protein [Lyngbya confervoides]MCM1981926.1 PepSY domain-containing protein [Lyngbya confervoides BDU141951]
MTHKSSSRAISLRQIHRTLAPILLGPILLTLITGTVYQMVDLLGKDSGFDWLLELHKGNLGPIRLEILYPFLNALGLLVLAVTGFSLWRTGRRRKARP